MKTHRMHWIAAACAAAIIAACSAALDHPTQQDVEWASTRWPETTLQDLALGRALYVQKCAGCHNLPLPAAYSPDEWEGYVAYMTADAKLTHDEQIAITRFLIAASARARGVPADDAAGQPQE
jgi:mono/diheme cytochrome c family protein